MTNPHFPRVTRELIYRCLEGDTRAIGELYRVLHHPSHALRRTVAHPSWRFGEDSEDIFQDIFYTRLIPALAQFTTQQECEGALVEEFEKYLQGVVRRACITEYRRRKAEKRGGTSSSIDYDAVQDRLLFDARQTDGIFEDQMKILVHKSLEALKQTCQEILRLRMQEKNSREISDQLGISLAAAEKRLARCLEKFRKLFLLRYGNILDEG